MAKTAEETLKTEVVIDLLWDSETAASAAYNRFTEAVAEAAARRLPTPRSSGPSGGVWTTPPENWRSGVELHRQVW